jgi:hypothetical protein
MSVFKKQLFSMAFRIMYINLARLGFLEGERIFSLLQAVTGPQEIKKMKVVFTIVTIDTLKNSEAIF